MFRHAIPFSSCSCVLNFFFLLLFKAKYKPWDMSVLVFCQLFSLTFYDVLNRLLIISVLYGDVWDEHSFVIK